MLSRARARTSSSGDCIDGSAAQAMDEGRADDNAIIAKVEADMTRRRNTRRLTIDILVTFSELEWHRRYYRSSGWGCQLTHVVGSHRKPRQSCGSVDRASARRASSACDRTWYGERRKEISRWPRSIGPSARLWKASQARSAGPGCSWTHARLW